MSSEPIGIEQMEQFLCSEVVGRLGLCGGDEVYVVPLNYTYVDGMILFHCALEGRKLDMIRANPRVCFEVSSMVGDPTPHGPASCDSHFRSVICWGTAKVVDDLEERIDVLNRFQARYDTDEKKREPITAERAARCGAVAIKVQRMTGRFWSGDEDDRRCEWEAEG